MLVGRVRCIWLVLFVWPLGVGWLYYLCFSLGVAYFGLNCWWVLGCKGGIVEFWGFMEF